jgi:hypothetical protein
MRWNRSIPVFRGGVVAFDVLLEGRNESVSCLIGGMKKDMNKRCFFLH